MTDFNLAEKIKIAVELAMHSQNATGEIHVKWSDSSMTTWVGKPSGDDIVVTIDISPMPPKANKG